MSKKIIVKIIVVVFVIIVIGIGCFMYIRGNSSENLIREGNSLMTEGNYTAALNDYNQLLYKNPNNIEANKLVKILNAYMIAEQKYKNGDFNSAKNVLNNIDSYYKKCPIASKIESLKNMVDNAITVQNQINDANSLVSKNNIQEAKKIIEKLESENLTNSQKNQLNQLNSGLKLKNNVPQNNKKFTNNEKQQYLDELSDIQNQIEGEPDQETQGGMNEQSYNQFKIWDNELNKIWGVLENTLPKSEMSSLRENEMNWINMKNQKENQIKQEYQGGSIMPLEVNSELAGLTKKRCYYLVNNYM